MVVIGLCGGSGSGKGTVCAIFAELGIKSIDTDKLYHGIISSDSECTMELVECFGKDVYANPGINRKALRDIVFSSSDKLKLLNEITHKHILSEVRKIIKGNLDARGIIIDAPLLFESGFDKECDVTVAITADEFTRLERITKRDGISLEHAKARIASQISDRELIQKCNYSIENSSTENELRSKVLELYQKLFNN